MLVLNDVYMCSYFSCSFSWYAFSDNNREPIYFSDDISWSIWNNVSHWAHRTCFMVILCMMNNAGPTEKKWLNFGGAITFQPVWRYSVRPGFETRLCYLVYSQARKLIGTARWPSSLGLLVGPSPHHCSLIGRAPLHSSVKTSIWCLH